MNVIIWFLPTFSFISLITLTCLFPKHVGPVQFPEHTLLYSQHIHIAIASIQNAFLLSIS